MEEIKEYVEKICGILDSHGEKYSLHTNKEEEFKGMSDNTISIKLVNGTGEEMFIDVNDEITLYFGGWHMHCYYEEFDEFKMFLNRILNSRMAAECIKTDGEWRGSYCLDADEGDHIPQSREEVLEYLKKESQNLVRKAHTLEYFLTYWDEKSSRKYTFSGDEMSC